MSSPDQELQESDQADINSPMITVHGLSAKQERRLVDYVEEKFLEITRGFKKRNHPSTTLPTLSSYLSATHPLLSVILQIPPIDPQTTLRTTFLLRLTGEFLMSVVGYDPASDSLPSLLDWLDELDSGWLAVLRSQAWDPETHSGVDLIVSSDLNVHSSPVSQTDRTRLSSILLQGTERLEEWLEGMHVEGAEDVQMALETLGLRQAFDDLFIHTLSEMGTFGMNLPSVPNSDST